MKKLFVLFLLVIVFSFSALAQKMAVHWYLPTMTVGQAERLKGYDMFIGDPEVFFSSREAISQLRRDNPEIKLICYVNPVEWFNPMFKDKPWSIKVINFLNTVPQWWLRGTDGKILSFWTGMQTADCRIDCPRIMVGDKSQNYIEFFSEVFIENILKSYKFDGVLEDMMLDQINFLGHYGLNRHGVDGNRDGRNDDSVALNQSWVKGLDHFARAIRSFGGPNFLIFSNPGNQSFLESVDGKQFENFPEIFVNESDTVYQGWHDNLNRAGKMKAAIFNSREETGKYFFTLCSAMLLNNVYFSYVQNKPFNPKWLLYLGKPLGRHKAVGEEEMRQFENGEVFVNPRLQMARVIYRDGTIRDK